MICTFKNIIVYFLAIIIKIENSFGNLQEQLSVFISASSYSTTEHT